MGKQQKDIEKLGIIKRVIQREIKANGDNLSLGYQKLADINESITDTYRIKGQVEAETKDAKLEYAVVLQNIKNEKKKINREYKKLEKANIKELGIINKEVIRLRKIYNSMLDDIRDLEKIEQDINKKKTELKELQEKVDKENRIVDNIKSTTEVLNTRFDKEIKEKSNIIDKFIKNIKKLKKEELELEKKIELMQDTDKVNVSNYNQRKKELQNKERELGLIYSRLRNASRKIFNTDLKL